jgi:hypothetical protein
VRYEEIELNFIPHFISATREEKIDSFLYQCSAGSGYRILRSVSGK